MNKSFRAKAASLANSRPLRKAGAVHNNVIDLWEDAECMDTRDRF